MSLLTLRMGGSWSMKMGCCSIPWGTNWRSWSFRPRQARHLRDFTESKDGTIWLADGESVFALRGKAPPERYSLANASLLYADEFGKVIAGDGHHLFEFNGIRFAMVRAPGLGNFVRVMVDHQNNLWMASGGLHGLSRKSNSQTELMTVGDGLASNDVRV